MQQSGFPLLIDLNCRCTDKPSAPMVIGNTINLSKTSYGNVTQLLNMQSMDLQNFTASRTDFLLVNEMDMSLFSKNKSDEAVDVSISIANCRKMYDEYGNYSGPIFVRNSTSVLDF